MNLTAIWNFVLEHKIIYAVAIFAVALFVERILLKYIIRGMMNRVIEKNREMEAKTKTLFSIIRTLLTIIIYFTAILFIIQTMFNTSASSIIAATGIVGVTVGLGAQSIVKDSFSGFFILLENQYKVGDLVTIGNFTGNVESVTIRTTTVKGFEGDRLIIPNGNMTEIINHSRSGKSIYVDVNVSYDADIDMAINVIKQTLKEAENEMKQLTGKLEFLGVDRLGEFSVTIRMLAHCYTGAQFEVKRELLYRIKKAMEINKIPMPSSGGKHEAA